MSKGRRIIDHTHCRAAWAILAIAIITAFSAHAQAQAPAIANVAAEQTHARDILSGGHPAFCYGGYRGKSREKQPTPNQLKEDVRILSAMGVKFLRTYNTQQFDHAENLLEAIRQVKQEAPETEMYVMLGAWINCQGAWTEQRDHAAEDLDNNTAEVNAAVELANRYPETVKVISVGNESMVHWAAQYYVQPQIIRKWVDDLQQRKRDGKLPKQVWITSSDNYESWGGGAAEYRTDELAALIRSVDYISLHTYPFHETHYDRDFWCVPESEKDETAIKKADAAVERAKLRAISQFDTTAKYVKSIAPNKSIHIGETGWASVSGGFYGDTGSKAADEYKAKRYYDALGEWTRPKNMTCFYFEAFDEQWKDPVSQTGSENHFGMITLKGKAKYAIWDKVDAGVFDGLTRDGVTITKTFDGDEPKLKSSIHAVPLLSELGSLTITTVNPERQAGQAVSENRYIVLHDSLVPDANNNATYASAKLKLNPWEGTCSLKLANNSIQITTGIVADGWWGCGVELQTDEKGEKLTAFDKGHLHFEIRGTTTHPFNVGFQSGRYTAGNQVNHFLRFGTDAPKNLTNEWTAHTIPIAKLNKGSAIKGGALSDVTSLLYCHGENGGDGKPIEFRRVYFSQD